MARTSPPCHTVDLRLPWCAVGTVSVLAAALLNHLPLEVVLVESLHLEGEDLGLPLLPHSASCRLLRGVRFRKHKLRWRGNRAFLSRPLVS